MMLKLTHMICGPMMVQQQIDDIERKQIKVTVKVYWVPLYLKLSHRKFHIFI